MRVKLGHNVRELLRGQLQSRSVYQYDPLPTNRALRLLKLHPTTGDQIRCSLECFESSKAPPFCALSYTWGYPLTHFSQTAKSKSFRQLDFLRKAADSSPGLLTRHGYPLSPDQRITDDTRCFPIECDGRTMLVTANLCDVLQIIGKSKIMKQECPDSKYVWIDSICVDQNNISERNAQVALMGDTFRAAQSVIVWLGPEDEFTKDALAVIDRISSIPRDTWRSIGYTDFFNEHWCEALGVGSLTYLNWLGFLAFINRPWFKRAWVVQELALANSALLVAGSESVRWEKLDATLSFINNRRWYHHLSTEKIRHITLLQKNPGIYEEFLKSKAYFGMGPMYLARTRHWVEKLEEKNEKPSLEVLIQMHRETEATDPRDKVYAFVGLTDKNRLASTEQPESTDPDYKLSVQEVYTRTVSSLLLLYTDLRLLSHVQDASSTKIPNLPSWVPDFSTQIQPYALAYRGTCNWSASSDSRWKPDMEAMRKSLLRVQGSQVAVVEATAVMPDESPNPATYWASIVKVATRLGDRYPFCSTGVTPQTRVEVLWRTLITNTYARMYPATPKCGKLFMDYILNLQIRHTLVPWSNTIDFQPHQNPTSDLTIPAWHSLLAMEPEGSLYGLQLYRERFSHVVESMFQGEYSPIQLAQLQHEFDIASGNMRRIFRTRDGLLGTGARSLSDGDEVWILAGARVPLILRRLPTGNYRLIGEAYVHGVMHGEAIIRGIKMRDITIE